MVLKRRELCIKGKNKEIEEGSKRSKIERRKEGRKRQQGIL